MSFSLSAEQLAAYDRSGLLCIRGGVDPRDALVMGSALWKAIELEYGMRRDAPETWSVRRPSGLTAALPHGVFDAMASPAVTSALDVLLARQWVRPHRWGVPLVNFPDRAGSWDVPHEQWHLDSPATPVHPTIARVFVLLAPLAPQGGGTLVVTGSHTLLQRLAIRAGQRLRSAVAKRKLWAEQPWFAALSSAAETTNRVGRFMIEGGEIDGVHVRVVEMTGQPGDVYFMHPCLLHAPSLNALDSPRLMLTQWIDSSAVQSEAQQQST